MALAIHFETLIADGIVKDHTEIAGLGYVSRAGMTQIMKLQPVTPGIQEASQTRQPSNQGEGFSDGYSPGIKGNGNGGCGQRASDRGGWRVDLGRPSKPTCWPLEGSYQRRREVFASARIGRPQPHGGGKGVLSQTIRTERLHETAPFHLNHC